MGHWDERRGIDGIASRLVAARRAAEALPNYPGTVPHSLQIAYEIQDLAIAKWRAAEPSARIAGWKVGRINPPLDANYGAERLAGPIFAGTIAAADITPAMPVFAGGFGAVEAEFVFQTAHDIAPDCPVWSLGAALDAIAAVHVGFEIASSPFPNINAHGPACTASDFGNNLGLVIGPAIAHWRDAHIDDWTVTLAIDGRQVGTGHGAAFPQGCAGSVRFLLEHLAARGIALPAGSWISTGAVTGVHKIAPGSRAVARFGSRAGGQRGTIEIACRIIAAAALAETPHG